MSLHEQHADELTLYAMDALNVEERLAVEKHLQECASCCGEMELLREDLALLAVASAGPEPPSHARERLMATIVKEPRVWPIRPRMRTVPWYAMGAVAALIIVVLLVRQNNELRQQLASIQTSFAADKQELLKARALLAPFTSGTAQQFTLVAGSAPPQPQGKALYVVNTGKLVFYASNMWRLPSEKTYELWLIPRNGGAPVPAGLFKPDARGSAAVVAPQLPVGLEAKAFAVTVEPEAGSSAPTSKPVLIGTGA